MKLSISNLEQLSGVPVHTIRIWERRYKALEPLRTAGNTRFYTDDHLKRLLNIVTLNQAGVKVSKACAMSAEQIDAFLQKDLSASCTDNINFESHISQLLNYGLTYNEFNFNSQLDSCISQYGMLNCYQEVMFPMLQRLGLMWIREQICPAQEHFLSNLVRQKLMVAINSIPLQSLYKTTWLLFLPEDEAHDIPLLFANYLLRSSGFRVVYLGEKVPMESLKDACRSTQISHMLFFMVRQRPIKEAELYLSSLSAEFKDCQLHLAGNGKLISKLSLEGNINWLGSIAELQKMILDTANDK